MERNQRDDAVFDEATRTGRIESMSEPTFGRVIEDVDLATLGEGRADWLGRDHLCARRRGVSKPDAR